MTSPRIIGMIGGMSWESTALYYRYVNEAVRAARGGHRSAECILYSVDFEPMVQAAAQGRWDEVAGILAQAGRALKAAGAGFFLLTANTAHRVADQVQREVGLPLLHIAQPTGLALQKDGRRRVGLLGTCYVTQDDLYPGWLRRHFGIEAVAPPAGQCGQVHDIILDELTRGIVSQASRDVVLSIIEDMQRQGLEGVVVACTELPLLLGQAGDAALPCYDTTRLHAQYAASMAG